jgi:hypothetical protein
MNQITITAEDFTVDAGLLAGAFGLDQDMVQARMRAGEITSVCATGVGEDEGRFQLTFHYQTRALRLIVDASGAVLSKSMEIDGRRRKATAPGAAGTDWRLIPLQRQNSSSPQRGLGPRFTRGHESK